MLLFFFLLHGISLIFNVVPVMADDQAQVFIRENFDDMEDWKPLH